MTTQTVPTGQFDFGRVLRRIFGVLGRNAVTVFGLSLLLVGLPAYLMTYGQATLAEGDGIGRPGILILVGLLGTFLGGVVLQAALVHLTVADLNGERAKLSASLGLGLRLALPLIGLALVAALGLLLGFLLLIIPGIILAVMWCVAVPVKVVERTGVFAALGRSRALTRGYRWPIFGLFVLNFIALVIIGAAVGAVFGVLALLAGSPLAVLAGINALAQVISTTIGVVGLACIYYELRQAKEGVGPEALAQVFA